MLTLSRYLMEGMLALVTHNIPIQCEMEELARFSPPPGQSCESYTSQYIQQAGGYVETLSDGLCGFCQYANGDEFAASFNIFWRNEWRDLGLFWAYLIFNAFIIFLASYLMLGGGEKFKRYLSPKARKAKKLRMQEAEGEGSSSLKTTTGDEKA